MSVKICAICRKTSDEVTWGVIKNGKISGSICRKCWRVKYKDTLRESKYLCNVVKKYGITKDQYRKMLEDSNDLCAVCGYPEMTRPPPFTNRLSVDHCHTTNKVRGLVCNTCNQRLGVIDDLEWMVKARAYLARVE